MRTVDMPPDDDRRPDDDAYKPGNDKYTNEDTPHDFRANLGAISLPGFEELQDLGEVLDGEDNPLLVASYNHLVARAVFIQISSQLSPEQTLIEQQGALQQATNIITQLYMPNVEQLTKEYAERLQPKTLQAELDPQFLRCLTDLTKYDTSVTLEVARNIAPHAFLPGDRLTQLEISQSIEEIYKDIVAQYGEQDTKGEVLTIFCRDFASHLADVHRNFIQKAFQSIPATDTDMTGTPIGAAMPEGVITGAHTDGYEYTVARQQLGREVRGPHSAWPQKLGDAALQALSVAAGVAVGVTLSAALRKKFGL